MGLRDIPRSAVGGYLKLVRLPIDTGLKLIGRGGNGSGAKLATDRVDATAREAAGAVLGDEELKRQGERRHRATDERARAATLRRRAQKTSAKGDAKLEQRTDNAEQRKQAAAKSAKRRQARAAETERKRKEAARTAAAKAEEKLDERERHARLETLDTKAEALEERQEAVTAADEAQRLEKAAAGAKAERKDG